MRAPSTPGGGGGSLRRFFSRRRHRAARVATPALGAAAQKMQARRTRLLDSWSLPELYALRELVHVAINKSAIAPTDPLALQRAARGDERTRNVVSSSASSSTTATSVTPPHVASLEDLKHQQLLQTRVDAALVRSKRFYFIRRADSRLRLSTRRQFVRLFPLLERTSKAVQRSLYRAFDADDSGKIEFDELCEMLARVRQARGSSVRDMAGLVFSWFQGDRSDAVLTYADVKLLAVTVMELGGENKVLTENGYDLVASLTKLVLGRGQTQVSEQTFCQEMDCGLGAHVLHVLLAPFGVPVGNDFICCPSTSLAKFAKTGDWKILRESMVAEQEAAASASLVSARVGPGGVLVGLAKHMEAATRSSGGRLVAHDGLRATGLINMGNTCFMNSALQCFVHSPVFREYFLSNRYEIEVNKKNQLGSRGAVAAAYAQLQSSLWRERDQGYLLPGRFRDEFTRVRRHFEETRQYDAHEFMVALLDCLHEDLNQGCRMLAASTEDAIQEKSSKCLGFGSFAGSDPMNADEERWQANHEESESPSDEVQGDAAWRAYTSVNSSVVVDLFHGQMRSETVCGTCGERKCTFDPNLFFSLPIPESNFVRVEVNVVLQARKLPSGDMNEKNADTAIQAVQRGYWLRDVGVMSAYSATASRQCTVAPVEIAFCL
ncbi:hypothetical protein PRNP1_015586 [Phytophthora ramorum]